MTNPPNEEPTPALIRTFSTGANRDVDHNKLDYEGFLSPLVLQRFAEYMHGKRRLVDGTLRDSDNWQKGMPLDAYMKSMFRHFMDVWLHHDGHDKQALEDLETALVGLLFNVQGYLHETIKRRLGTAKLVDLMRNPKSWAEIKADLMKEGPGDVIILPGTPTEVQLELDLQGGADLRGLAAREAGDATFIHKMETGLADAYARQDGVNLDGTERRETLPKDDPLGR